MTARLNRRLARVVRSSGGGGGSYALNYTVTQAGWLTAPIAALQGEIPSSGSVSIGGISAQLDVLNKWPDNSLKYGTATAKMTSTGVKAITNLSPPPVGMFTPTAPVLTVQLTERVNNAVVRFPLQIVGVGTGGSTAYYYRHSAVDGTGHETFPCFVSKNHIGWSGVWNATLSSTNKVRLQNCLPTGSASAKVYGRTATVNQLLMATQTASTPAVSSVTASGTEATVTTSVVHNLVAGDRVTIFGCTQAAYNMIAVVTAVPTTTTFKYTMLSAPSSPATGSPVATYFIYYDDGSATPSGAFKTSTVDDPGTVWTATLGAYSGTDKWLDGPNVLEWRKTVALVPSKSTAVPSPSGTPKYVSTTGNDSTGTGTIGAPWLTVAYGVAQLVPGDLLYVRGGTYTGSSAVIDSQTHTVPSGTSWTNPITISGYPGETVILRPPSNVSTIRLNTGAPHYLIIQDLTLDMVNTGASTDADGIFLSTAHHIRMQRLDLKNGRNFGVHFGDSTPFNEFLNCSVHDFGTAASIAGDGHGFYITGSDNLFEGNDVYNNAGYGFHIYNNAGGHADPSRNIIRNNKIHDNGIAAGVTTYGVVVAWGDANLVYNNTIYSNKGGVQVYTSSTATGIYHNTIYNNATYEGIALQFYGSAPTVRNNIVYLNGSDIVDYGGTGSPVIDHNLTTNPTFVDTATFDFHVQAGSAALDVGTPIAAVTRDNDGFARPEGTQVDIGAYERVVTHPFGTATFDVRSFSDGDHRANVMVQTARDIATMNQFSYDVEIRNGGVAVPTAYTPATGFQHYSFTGWQQFVYIGSGQEATFTFDFTKFYDAKLLPKILPGVINRDYTADLADTTKFGLGRFGLYNEGVLNSPGANPYLAPIANWDASYLVHQSASQRAVVLHQAYNAFASWSFVQITNSSDQRYKVTDAAIDGGDMVMFPTNGVFPTVPKCPMEPNPRGGNTVFQGGANGSVYGYEQMEDEHQPPVGIVAYYTTADRCYLEAAKGCANFFVFFNLPGVGSTWPDLFDDGTAIYRGRGSVGGTGTYMTYTNDPRAAARPFRCMVYAAQMCPDADPERAYFINNCNDTYAWLANYHAKRATNGSPLRDALSVWWETTQGGGPAAYVYYDNVAPGTTIKWSFGSASPYGAVEEAWAVYWGGLQGIFTIPAGAVSLAKRLSIYYVVTTTDPTVLDPGAGLGTFVMTPARRRIPGALPIEYPATLAEFVHWAVNHTFMFVSNERRLACSIDVASRTLTAAAGTFSSGMVGFPVCIWGPYGSNWTDQRYRDFGAGPVQIDLGGAYTILQYISETQVVLDVAPASANASGGTVLLGQQFSYPPCIGECDGPEARLAIAMCEYWGVANAGTAKAVAAAYNGGELETSMNSVMPGFAIVVPQ